MAYHKTGLHGLRFISTVDLLQPPRATVHPPSTSTCDCSSTGSCSSSFHRALLHRLLFNHPSTGYCSSCPPPSTVHPALHGVVLFILPSTGSCSSSPNRLDRSGSCSSRGNTTGSCSSRGNATDHCSSKPPCNAHCSSNRLASVSSSSEGITPSGSVNSHRSIARVQ